MACALILILLLEYLNTFPHPGYGGDGTVTLRLRLQLDGYGVTLRFGGSIKDPRTVTTVTIMMVTRLWCTRSTRRRGSGGGVTAPRDESRLRKSAQDDKWSFCLTAGTLCPANQEKQ
jgi:hypothetical protein